MGAAFWWELLPFSLLNQVPSWPSKQSTTHTSKGHQNLLYPRRSSLSCSPEYNVPLNSQTLVISFPLSFFSTFESQLNICWPQFSSKKKAPPPRSVLKKGENESSTCGPGSWKRIVYPPDWALEKKLSTPGPGAWKRIQPPGAGRTTLQFQPHCSPSLLPLSTLWSSSKREPASKPTSALRPERRHRNTFELVAKIIWMKAGKVLWTPVFVS